jgi:magnesium-transporting ATPase (P-type)
MARRGAIIKQLSAVETLGSTAHIATDKTGTLTLNEMTARRLHMMGRSFRITGEGYGTDGKVLSGDGGPLPAMSDALLSMALCNDALIRGGTLVGDPTEGALVALAEKGGTDVDGVRGNHPRVAEVPFDSEYKFMATFRDQNFTKGDSTPARFRCFAKGAPAVLLERADSILTSEGILPLTDEDRTAVREDVEALAAEGLRTLMIAGRWLDGELPSGGHELRASADHLTIYAVVGIVDPPRVQAAEAIATARAAGITVHMITGDHLVTASSIAKQLDIPGEAASGAALDGLDDVELNRRAAGFGVLARVAPGHKIRVVKALQKDGNIVAMTGDGVNALQILWVNIIMDGPPALALGVDPAEPDIMKQKRRPANEPLLTLHRLLRILGLGVVMAAGTIGVLVLVLAPVLFPESGDDPLVGTTLAFTTFVFFQVFNLLKVRSEAGSVFALQTFTNCSIWVALLATPPGTRVGSWILPRPKGVQGCDT